MLFPLGSKIRVIVHSNIKIPMHLKIKNNTKWLPKWPYVHLINTLIWDITWYFHVLFIKMYLFAITAYFLSFPDKNLRFSSQRRREGVVGDANGNISK